MGINFTIAKLTRQRPFSLWLNLTEPLSPHVHSVAEHLIWSQYQVSVFRWPKLWGLGMMTASLLSRLLWRGCEYLIGTSYLFLASTRRNKNLPGSHYYALASAHVLAMGLNLLVPGLWVLPTLWSWLIWALFRAGGLGTPTAFSASPPGAESMKLCSCPPIWASLASAPSHFYPPAWHGLLQGAFSRLWVVPLEMR